MADASYDGQAKVYIKQGATEQVIANGGTLTLESGGAIAFESGGGVTLESGSTVTVESGGEIDVDSGGKIDLNDGASFYCVDTSFPAADVKYMLLSLKTVTAWGVSGTNLSGDSYITPNYGYHNYSAATGLSKTSTLLPSAHLGAFLVLNFSAYDTDANISIMASTGASNSTTTALSVSLQTAMGAALSSLEISAAGWIKLVCATEGTWTIVEDNDSVTERLAA